MKGLRFVVPVLGFLLVSGAAVSAQSPQQPDKAEYVPHIPDPVLTEMQKADKKAKAAAEEKTESILDKQKAEEKKEREERKDFRVDLSGLQKPSSPEAFKIQAWHFPPVPQYLTGTCWSFSTNSYLESEVHRITGKSVKLSEMWTVYHEYLEKAKRYVEMRGDSVFDEGSESEALPVIWKEYGIVTEKDYPGVCSPDGRYDHSQMIREMKNYLEYCKDHNYWNEAQILDTLKLILNKTMGAPPDKVTWEGKTYTPKQFLTDVLRLNMDDYVSFISTESMPFYTRGELKVEDNWRHDATYINVPLDVFYDTIVKAVKAGSTVAIGGDVSEPGYDGYHKVAVVPTFDIPRARINQDSREMRISNETTTDDHGIQIVGYMKLGGDDWFLIKDSARAARKAPPEGYLYYRGDYVKLKMLSFMVHKDFAKDVLAKLAPAPATVAVK